ncbi:MAG: hypothetical protein KBG15_15410, partial [Kofleriaceae bacterium]|nr:hypothetical protein [Kofleriaceae bacterium]
MNERLSKLRRRMVMAGATITLASAASAGNARADDPRQLFGLGAKPASPSSVATPATAKESAATTLPAVTPPPEQSPAAMRWTASAAQLLRLPTADFTHDVLASFALGVSRDDTGLVIGGASGLENRWTLGGAPIDDISSGGASTTLPLQFLDQLSVQIGGFAAADRTSTGGVIDVSLRKAGAHHRLSTWGLFGVAASRTERALVPVSYALMRSKIVARQNLTVGAVADGPIRKVLGGATWYLAGLAATAQQRDLVRTGARLVDQNADGEPDLDGTTFDSNYVTETVYRSRQNTDSLFLPGLLQVGWTGRHDEVDVALVGSAARNTRFVTNSSPAAAAVDRWFVTGDIIAHWKHRFAHGRLQLTAAWHRSVREESAHDAAASDEPQRLNAYLPAALVEPDLLQACSDAGADPYPAIPNCPIPGWYATGGAGRLIDATADRPSATLDYEHGFGVHTVRTGVTFEDSRVVNVHRFTGDRFIRSLFPSHVDAEYYVRPGTTCDANDLSTPCSYVSATEQRFRTRYVAGFLQDTWRLPSDVVLNA